MWFEWCGTARHGKARHGEIVWTAHIAGEKSNYLTPKIEVERKKPQVIVENRILAVMTMTNFMKLISGVKTSWSVGCCTMCSNVFTLWRKICLVHIHQTKLYTARKRFRIVTATNRLFHIILNYGAKRFGYRPQTMIFTKQHFEFNVFWNWNQSSGWNDIYD